MTGNIEKVGTTGENSQTNTEKHPLEKMPTFKEHIKQFKTSSSQTGVSNNFLPRTPAIESVLYGNGKEVHIEPTDLSLKLQERPPILMTDEDFSPDPGQSADFKPIILKEKVKDIMISTFENRVNKSQLIILIYLRKYLI